jgi:hypothetical protein
MLTLLSTQRRQPIFSSIVVTRVLHGGVWGKEHALDLLEHLLQGADDLSVSLQGPSRWVARCLLVWCGSIFDYSSGPVLGLSPNPCEIIGREYIPPGDQVGDSNIRLDIAELKTDLLANRVEAYRRWAGIKIFKRCEGLEWC